MTHFEKLPRTFTSPPPAVQLRDDELDLFAVFRLARRRIVLIVVVFILVTAAALPSILSLQKQYFAQSRLLLQRPLSAGLSAPSPGEAGAFDLDTELQRLLSRDIAVRMIGEFDLTGRPEFNPSLRPVPPIERLRGSIRRWISGEAEPPANPGGIEPVLGAYFGALAVYRSGTSQVVEVGFRSLDPQLAAGVANRLVEVYLDEREQTQRGRLETADKWLAEQVAEQRRRVAAVEGETTRLRENSGLASNEQENAASTIATLSAGSAALATERTRLGARLAGLNAAEHPGDAAELVDTDAMGELSRSLQEQQRDLSRLLAKFGDAHESVLQARSRIADTEAAIAAEADRFAKTLKAQIAALDDEDATVKAGSAAARATLSRLDQAEARVEVLRGRAEKERTALDTLEQRRRTLQSQLELPVAEVEVLSPAAVPLYPHGRGRSLYLMVAMVAAGGLALTAAVIAEMLDRGVRSPQQLDGIGGIVHGGMIPKLPRRAVKKAPDLLAQQPDGMFPESVRGLALTLERAGGKMPRTITVTSALPGDGKSLLAVSLALELAAAGRRVLLVDGDLRRGVVHDFFGTPVGPGLADFLCGDHAVTDVVRRHAPSGLEYVPRGAPRVVPYQEQQRVDQLIRHAKANDQIIVFDSAPVLATTGTSVLAGISDRTILVARWGRTTRRTVELALQKLQSASRDDVVVAINMVNPRRHALYAFTDAGLFSPQLRKYYP